MKCVVLFVLLCAVVAAEKKSCKSQSDCGGNECCLESSLHGSSYCERRGTVGDICLTQPLHTDEERNVYRIACPCRGMQMCLGKINVGNKEDLMNRLGTCVVPPM